MANVQYNVGTFIGLLGTAVVYSAKTTGGTEFLTYKATVTIAGAPVEKWTFMSRSGMQAYLAGNSATISSNIDLTKMADKAPDGVLDADGYVVIDNGANLPRLYTSQAFYSLKGTDIAAFTGDTGTPISGGKDGSGSTVVINSSAKTISEYVTEAVTFVTKNPLILIAIAFGVSELFGWTNVLGLHKKKGKKK